MKWETLFDISATLFYGLIKDHPFHDANKRTAFLSLLYQLYRSDWCPSVPERELEDFTVEIADDQLGKYARFNKFVKDGEPDPEIKFISWYLRKSTRQMDQRYYPITYRQLQTILSRFGYELANPRHNYIDIFRIEKRRPVLGIFGAEREIQTKVGQIGFPRWTAQIGKSALKTVRHVTHLTAADGVDSGTFFKGLDVLESLIASYHAPLLRLANR